jgi:hypothetical protein
MARFVQCIRVDSKFRASGTGSDFTYELPVSLECNQETVAFVSAVTFPYSMKTIETGINDKLYYRTSLQGITTDWILTIEEGNYDGPSFAAYLQTKLNEEEPPEGVEYWPNWIINFEYATGALEIQWGTDPSPPDEPPRTWEIVSEDSLMRRSFDWTGPPYDPSDPQTCSNVLRLEAGATFVTDAEVFQTGTYDAVADYHCVYLHSTLSNYASIGPQPFTRDVLTRIPINVGPGGIVHWAPSGSGLEVAPIPQASFRTLSFRLCDSRGKPLRLHGGDVSIEIYFTSSPNYSGPYQ